MRTFIQVTELWTPTADRSALQYHGGLYGAHHAFREASRAVRFALGEGLPGRAWAERQPILLKDLQHSYFLRGEAAATAGLTCGLALPVFAGDYLLAVLVFFCGSDDEHVGAIEHWHNDPATNREMAMVDGYFGIAESLQWTAQTTRFMHGFGLPGLVWKTGRPEIMQDLVSSSRFLRKDDARRVGLNKGLGLPVFSQPGHHHVVTFLSALGTPIARRFEVWLPTADGAGSLVFAQGMCDADPEFAAVYQGVALLRGSSLLNHCADSGLPQLSDTIALESSPPGLSAQAAGYTEALAMPVLRDGRLQAVVAFYF
jgi:hypothetical protein